MIAEAGMWLVHRAKGVIRGRLAGLERPLPPTGGPEVLFSPGACFVTLTHSGRLRGCIGSLEPWRPLWLDGEENALSAAFGDPRFPPLTGGEESGIKVEVSVLTFPVPAPARGSGIVEVLKPGIHGVIFRCRGRRSTFLPQVWDQLPDKEDFLDHLSRKAGLPGNAWRSPEGDFLLYTVEKFSE